MEKYWHYLNHWSGGLEPKVFELFKSDIQILDVTKYPVGYLKIETLIEARSIKKKRHMPQNIPSNVLSSTFIPCDLCSGSGTQPCDKCGGTGELPCATCAGTVKISCDRCAGSGKVDQIKMRTWMTDDGVTHQNQITDQILCMTCAGTGRIDCSDCTSGHLDCDRCEGSGKLACSRCDGTGRIVEASYEQLETLSSEETLIIDTPERQRLFHHFSLEPTFLDDSAAIRFEKTYEGAVPDDEKLTFAPSDFFSRLDRTRKVLAFINRNQTTSALERILNTRMRYAEVDYLCIKYQFRSTSYELLVDPVHLDFYAEENPFVKLVEEATFAAIDAYIDGNYKQSLSLANSAVEHFESSPYDLRLKKLLTASERMLKWQRILIGAFGGLVILCILLILVITL